jgi:hypothetical protein
VHQKKASKTLVRVVEPYALYPTKDGSLILESRLIDGDSQETPPPHWCPIPLAEITAVTLEDKTFPPHDTYKPTSKRYTRALCCVR